MLTAVIIEDEEKGLENLQRMLAEHCDDVEIVGSADGVESGYELFSDPTLKVDIAFMDINLHDGKVFQLLNRLRPIDFDIIFVTAYDQFAVQACEYASIGYILKPIDPDQLITAVSRINPRRQSRTEERLEVMQNYTNHPNAFEKMSIAALDGIHFVKIRAIIRFEAEDNYTHIFLDGGQRITASKTIKAYEDLLGPFNFYRVHKRHVINLNYMKKFVKGDGGYLIMDDGINIEVSRRRRPAFMEKLRQLQGGL